MLEVRRSFETSETTYPAALLYVPEDLNSQPHRREISNRRTFSLHKILDIFCIAEDLLASDEDLCCVEVVKYMIWRSGEALSLVLRIQKNTLEKIHVLCIILMMCKGRGKATPLQAWIGP
jgi:hypothetical protein